MKFRKKPVIINAEPYRKGIEDGFDYGVLDEEGFMSLAGDDIAGYPVPFIKTLEGKHYITPTDWIVTGIKGERYPVKEDIFEMTYEEVEESMVWCKLTKAEKLIVDEMRFSGKPMFED